MSRFFDNSDDYLLIESAVISAHPFTVAGWMYLPSGGSSGDCLVFIGDKDVTNNYWGLWADVSGNAAFTARNATEQHAVTTMCPTAEWFHLCGICRGTADRSVYFNGGDRVDNSVVQAPNNIDRVSIGRFMDSTPAGTASGMIAHVVLWNVALPDDEVALIGAGRHPMAVHAANIVAYWNLDGDVDPEPDRTGKANNLTVSGSIKDALSPPIDPEPGYEDSANKLLVHRVGVR